MDQTPCPSPKSYSASFRRGVISLRSLRQSRLLRHHASLRQAAYPQTPRLRQLLHYDMGPCESARGPQATLHAGSRRRGIALRGRELKIPGRSPTVDPQRGAGDPLGLVAAQVGDRLSDILGRSRPGPRTSRLTPSASTRLLARAAGRATSEADFLDRNAQIPGECSTVQRFPIRR